MLEMLSVSQRTFEIMWLWTILTLCVCFSYVLVLYHCVVVCRCSSSCSKENTIQKRTTKNEASNDFEKMRSHNKTRHVKETDEQRRIRWL